MTPVAATCFEKQQAARIIALGRIPGLKGLNHEHLHYKPYNSVNFSNPENLTARKSFA